MEKSMNNVLDDVYDLKKLIIESDEYKNYIKSLKVLEKNEEVNSLTSQIIKEQKDIVRTKKESKTLDELYDKLFSIKDYNEDIKYSKE